MKAQRARLPSSAPGRPPTWAATPARRRVGAAQECRSLTVPHRITSAGRSYPARGRAAGAWRCPASAGAASCLVQDVAIAIPSAIEGGGRSRPLSVGTVDHCFSNACRVDRPHRAGRSSGGPRQQGESQSQQCRASRRRQGRHQSGGGRRTSREPRRTPAASAGPASGELPNEQRPPLRRAASRTGNVPG